MSTPTVPQTITASQANKETPLQEDIRASCHQTVYAYREATSSGLTFGYHGGRWGPYSVAAGTLALTASNTNHIVVLRSNGVISVSTSTTNWDNSTDYARVYRVTTDGSGITNLYGSDFDYRGGPGGVHGSLPDAASDEIYSVDGSPGSDDTYAGRAITGVNAGATIAQWEAVYLASDGEWALADANGTGTYPMRGLAAAAGTDGNPMTVVTEGVVRNDAWAWTVGGQLYLSGTAGGLTQTAPSTSGDKVQQVGFAISADVIYLNVGAATFIEVA